MSAPLLSKEEKECRDRRTLILVFMFVTMLALIAGLTLLFVKDDWNARSGIGVGLLLLLGAAGVFGNIVLLSKQPSSISRDVAAASYGVQKPGAIAAAQGGPPLPPRPAPRPTAPQAGSLASSGSGSGPTQATYY